MKRTLVLGASTKPHRASYQAIERLQMNGIDVIAIGARRGIIKSIPIHTNWPEIIDVHTITIYLSAANQSQYENEILMSGAKRIIFNPGAENASLLMRAKQIGMVAMNACTLVMISIADY